MPTNIAPAALTGRALCTGSDQHDATLTTDGIAALVTVDGPTGRDTEAVLVKTDGTLEAACPGHAGAECLGYLAFDPRNLDPVTADLSGVAALERD